MEKIKMEITDDGYRNIAEMSITNVVDNIATHEYWSKTDASMLLMGAMMIVRHLSDDEFILLTQSIEDRYDGR